MPSYHRAHSSMHQLSPSSPVPAYRQPSLHMDFDYETTPRPSWLRRQPANNDQTPRPPSPTPSGMVASTPMDATFRSTSSHGTSHGTSSKNSSIDFDKPVARPKRKRINPEQLEVLLALFAETDTPSYELRESVGAQLGMSNREVQVWYQNRRAKERTARGKHQGLAQPQTQHQQPPSHALYDSDRPTSASSRSPSLFPITVSSPPRPYPNSLPAGFNAGRRRSVSASAVDVPRSYSMHEPHSVLRAPQRPPSADTPVSHGFGPVRPRLTRFHSHAVTSHYSRTSVARDAAWQNTQAALHGLNDQRSLKSRASSSVLNLDAQPRKYAGTAVRAVSSSPPERHAFLAPSSLPSPNPSQRLADVSSTAHLHSASTTPSAAPVATVSDSLADRRNTRLPPIKLLLDMADAAGAWSELSPTSLTSSSSHTSGPSLASPLAHLNLRSPTGPHKSDQEVAGYFESRITGHAGGHHTPSFGGYTFGRDFKPA